MSDKTVIFAGYVCEVVDDCTCAGGGEWPHEPHCGLEPLRRVDERPEEPRDHPYEITLDEDERSGR